MVTATRWVLGAVAVGVALAAAAPAGRADDPKPKADAKDEPALKEELLKLNKVTGDDAQRAAVLRLAKDKAKGKKAVAEAMRMAKAAKGDPPFNYNACLILARTAH